MKFSKILLISSLLVFIGAGCSKHPPVITVNSDDELFEALRKPLAETVMFQPSTLFRTYVDDTTYYSPRKLIEHEMVYTFYSNMRDLSYTIFLKRISRCNENYEVPGKWKLATLPKCKDSVITLRNFIFQMLSIKNNTDPKNISEPTWNTSVYSWNLGALDEEGYRLIDVNSTEGYNWKVRVKNM